ncbi:MAG: NAD(P)-dependent malic enzyme [Candidatus Hodarchaeales archaeon]|jgi:malate dehydrogenase (oxaloacetate-decarboxylating)
MSSLDGLHDKKEALVKYTDDDVLKYHQNNFPGHGKFGMIPKTPLRTILDLTLAYSPGVAVPCKAIEKNEDLVYEYCAVGNTVAVVSNGTRVLGLGPIGPRAGLPVMEGKCILFKGFGYVDAVAIVLKEQDPDKIIDIVENIAPSFGGINLEDIRKPDCYKIETEVAKRVDIPIWHDDQHGTALVTAAALLNSLKVVGKNIEDCRIIMQGSGASGTAISQYLLDLGVQGKNIILSDRNGAVYYGRKDNMDFKKEELAKKTNLDNLVGPLDKVTKEFAPDVLIGASGPNTFTKEMIRNMNSSDPIVFAIANPVPEIWPEDAIEAGAKIVATGRSDYKNQANNVLGFPGVFRGALDVRAKTINTEMKIAAAYAVANVVTEDELGPEMVLPNPTNHLVYQECAVAVADAAMKTGVARIHRDAEWIRSNFQKLRKFYLDHEDPVIDKRQDY